MNAFWEDQNLHRIESPRDGEENNLHQTLKRKRPLQRVNNQPLLPSPLHTFASLTFFYFVLFALSSTTTSLQPLQENSSFDGGNDAENSGVPVTSPFRIVIDVGSTGSRLHVFETVTTTINDPTQEISNDSISSEKNTKSTTTRIECLRRGSSKAWTPLSAFSPLYSNDESSQINSKNEPLNSTHVANHMLPLFEYASIIIPSEYHSTTPVRIAATAGMRLLPPQEQTRVYDALYEGLSEQTDQGRFSFISLKREDVFTLDGEREGFFGAVAANYLNGVIDAELRLIVPSDEMDDSTSGESFKSKRIASSQDVSAGKIGSDDAEDDKLGLCTNKFGMCEQDAENVIFGPSHHYVSQQRHDVREHGPLGALDMGGSSTQIVYRRPGPGGRAALEGSIVGDAKARSGADLDQERADDGSNAYDIPSHLNDDEFFSTSYLSYGADQFRERLWDLWVSEANRKILKDEGKNYGKNDQEKHELPVILNPCSFVGYSVAHKGYNLTGTGNAVLCAEQVNRLIPHHHNVIDLDELYDENLALTKSKSQNELRSPESLPKKKMVGGVEHPPISGKFYGMSLYFFTLDCMRELSDPDHPIHVTWPTPSIDELAHALDGFCSRKWQGDLEEVQHEAHEHTRAEVLPHRCVEAVYMVTLLRDGFGFHPSSRDITFTQWVDGNEVEWSLGMALSEYAADRKREREINTDLG